MSNTGALRCSASMCTAAWYLHAWRIARAHEPHHLFGEEGLAFVSAAGYATRATTLVVEGITPHGMMLAVAGLFVRSEGRTVTSCTGGCSAVPSAPSQWAPVVVIRGISCRSCPLWQDCLHHGQRSSRDRRTEAPCRSRLDRNGHGIRASVGDIRARTAPVVFSLGRIPKAGRNGATSHVSL